MFNTASSFFTNEAIIRGLGGNYTMLSEEQNEQRLECGCKGRCKCDEWMDE